NQKGGVGKTTTTVNVGMGLARAGQRVLLIDLDPQSHLSLHLGVDPKAGRPGVYELLTSGASIAKARVKAGSNLWLIGSSIDLAAAEMELAGTIGREVILRDLLERHFRGTHHSSLITQHSAGGTQHSALSTQHSAGSPALYDYVL